MKSSGSGTRVVLLWHTQSTFALLLTNDKRLQQQHALKNVRIMSSEDKTPRHCGKNVWEQLKKKKDPNMLLKFKHNLIKASLVNAKKLNLVNVT